MVYACCSGGQQKMIVPYNTYKMTYAWDGKSLTTPEYISPGFVRWGQYGVELPVKLLASMNFMYPVNNIRATKK